jgi:fructokinase
MTNPLNGSPENPTRRPIIFGEVLFDRFPDGVSVLGGAPFNVAWHLQGFGEAPLVVSRVGEDEPGDEVRRRMQEWKMDPAGLQIDTEHPTGAVEITFEGTDHRFEILPDQAYDHVEAKPTLEAVRGGGATLLYHGSLAIRTAKARAALDGLRAKLDAPVFVDINLRAPWWDEADLPVLFDRSRWLKVNDEELSIVAGLQGLAAEKLEDSARRLRDAHDLELLIVTCGDRGAFALERSGTITTIEPEADTHIADTIGAGDAFSSVVLVGLMREWPLPSILDRAQAFASRICGQRGATRVDPELYREMEHSWS